jgi:hypothetical protein
MSAPNHLVKEYQPKLIGKIISASESQTVFPFTAELTNRNSLNQSYLLNIEWSPREHC